MNCKLKQQWINMELEHTNSRNVARKIALDHIHEFGCDYYPQLIKLEKRLRP